MTGTKFHLDIFQFKDLSCTIVNLQVFSAHFTIITGHSACSEAFLAILPKTLTIFGSLPSLDKPLLAIILKSTLQLFATLIIPSAVDPIPNENRIFTRSFLAASTCFSTQITSCFKVSQNLCLDLSQCIFFIDVFQNRVRL